MVKKSLIKGNKNNPAQCSDTQEKIRKKAYELFEKKGYRHGNDLKDWLEAERIVRSQLR